MPDSSYPPDLSNLYTAVSGWADAWPGLDCEEKAQKKYRTFLVNDWSRHSVSKEVRKFCTCFLWYFEQSLMNTTYNMCRHSVLSSYSIFSTFSELQHEIFASVPGLFQVLLVHLLSIFLK